MNLLMSFTIIGPCKSSATLRTSKRLFPRMAPHVIPLMKAPRELLIANLTLPRRRTRRPFLNRKGKCLVFYLGVEEAYMLFHVFVGSEAEFNNGAVRESALEGAVVTVDVFVAALGVFETFVEVEAGNFGAFKTLLAVKIGEKVWLARC